MSLVVCKEQGIINLSISLETSLILSVRNRTAKNSLAFCKIKKMTDLNGFKSIDLKGNDIALNRLANDIINFSKALVRFELATIRAQDQHTTNLAGWFIQAMEWMATYTQISARGLLLGYVIIIHFQ